MDGVMVDVKDVGWMDDVEVGMNVMDGLGIDNK